MSSFLDIPILEPNVAVKANDLLALSDSSVLDGPTKKVVAALIAQGFTHAFRVDYNNAELVAQDTNDTAEAITLMAIPANSVVDKARVVVTTAFTGLTACNVFVGRTADPDGYVASTSALAKTVVQSTGAEIDTINELDVITASDQSLLVTFDPGSNTEALADLTAGSVVILVSLTEIADYADIAVAE